MTAPARSPVEAALYIAARRASILEVAGAALASRAPKYADAGSSTRETRLAALLDRVVAALAERDVDELLAHTRAIAEERFRSGYDLGEVQAAYSALEEAVWAHVLSDRSPERAAVVLPAVGAMLGAAKDELARTYVTLATGAHAPAVDLAALASGIEPP